VRAEAQGSVADLAQAEDLGRSVVEQLRAGGAH
jgi:hypothetical protein